VSRREADSLIEKKLVTVNGTVAPLGARIPEGGVVAVRGKSVATAVRRTVLFHKPAGYVSSRRQQGDNPTLYDLLPSELHALKPVGRLDKDSSGLLLLTNDGDFAHQMTHPSFHKQKSYEVTLDHELEPLHQQMISDYGVQLEDGPSKLALTRLSDTNRTDWHISMHEGRNRQIRRTFAALGYTVTALHRTHFGNYSLGDIKPGSYKDIDIS
jgi:pseudouridine synthase